MMKSERQNRIIELVKREGYCSLDTIAKELGVSSSTVRRDIEFLDSNGALVRERGGASRSRSNEFSMYDQKLNVRMKLEAESKKAIAQAALKLIQPGSTIFMDAGSSTLTLAKLLPSDLRITVVTDSLSVSRVLAEKGIATFLIGGTLKPTTDATVGPMAEEQIRHFFFSQAFMGANAVDRELGFMTPDISEACTKRAACESAGQVVFLADRSKFNIKSVISFAPLKGQLVITDYVDSDHSFPSLKLVEVKVDD